jgi:hypothetical protein
VRTGDSFANADRDSDGNSHSDSNTDSYAYTDSYTDGLAFTDSDAKLNSDSNTFGNANPNRQLPGNLYDIYYHRHDNRRGHRYRQPLRRLHHGHHATLPGKRVRHCDFSGVCRVGRRHTLHRALQQTVLVARVRAGGSGDWTGSVPEYPLP